jgi:hypothetical protein
LDMKHVKTEKRQHKTFELQVQNMATSVNLSLLVCISMTEENDCKVVEMFLLLSIFDILVYCRFYLFTSRICSLCLKTVLCVIFVNNCDAQEYLEFS